MWHDLEGTEQRGGLQVSAFRSFEVNAIRILCSEKLGDELIGTVIRDAELVTVKQTGVGYFVTARHCSLPSARISLHQPIITGSVSGVSGTYLASIEGHKLVLEFAAVTEVPANIRELDVRIEVQH